MTESAPLDAQPSFADLLDDERLVRALADVGYESPSPIQAEAIPPLLAGHDIIGMAQTGTGKTAAFALPILSGIDVTNPHTQAMVLAPTRELALQVAEAFASYAKHLPGLNVVPVYGGAGYTEQLAALRKGAHVVVGTPGRVIDHLERGRLDLTTISYLVLDEADEMLKMGFADDVERILRDTPTTKQVALFSATMPSTIRRLASQYLTDPVEVKVHAKTVTAKNVRQRWLLVPHFRKLDALARFLEVEPHEGVIVFVRTKQVTEELAEQLRAYGHTAQAINGDLVQAQRERAVNALKNGSLDILVATDVAARGLDVDRVSHVVNYDIPHDPEAYVHRIGRTGRAGRSGDAVLFVTPRERRLLGVIERTTGQPVTPMDIPTAEQVNARRVEQFEEAITDALATKDVHMFRGLVSKYAESTGVDPIDVAAALAVRAHEGRSFLLEAKDDIVLSERDRGRDRADRSERPERPQRPTPDGMAVYRLAVGKRQRVTPKSIMGALANEGGLGRADFGNISIRFDHSLVELPDPLPSGTESKLSRTRIGGELIQLERDRGARRSGSSSAPRHAGGGRSWDNKGPVRSARTPRRRKG
ncbi:DEAD/DEAH box helicase [Mumia zhuanghuii]|uniref:ATP-dependent RNA helicase DeaD n=1 Tax=Mumia zhuanghuii TaxID=2585211 RepID=A0A5C4MMI0_9ACTN|nr:DEAD/DEAH box helicase [Mumia zhuanghuii]TNC37484.1 DEAD/DEAH box helicase [Mumia zhuanghuii]TNC44189.1 DEAD/DEAH box helicase [Mumia zhuanghuii]